MSISAEFTELIAKRKSWHGDIDYERNPIIQAMIKLLTRNVDCTVQFLKEECNEEQLIWLSEILDEIIETTKSHEIVDACYIAIQKYPEATENYNIKYFVDSAAEYFE